MNSINRLFDRKHQWIHSATLESLLEMKIRAKGANIQCPVSKDVDKIDQNPEGVRYRDPRLWHAVCKAQIQLLIDRVLDWQEQQ